MVTVEEIRELYIRQRLKPSIVASRLKITRKELDELIQKYNLKEEKNNLRRQTMIERYGSTSPFSSEAVKQKSNNTKLEKYGDKNYNNRNKAEITNLERYGAKSPLGNKEIYQMTQQSNRNNHMGKLAWNTQKSIDNHNYKEIHYKASNTIKEKYNFTSPIQFNFTEKQQKILLNKENFENYVKEMIEKSNNGKIIYESLDINHSVFYRYFYKYELNKKYTLDRSSSKEEYEIMKWLMEIKPGIEIEHHCRRFKDINNKVMELDIYLPEYNVAIEYNGTYWHSKLNIDDNKYHYNKSVSCENIGIRLIHIFEYEWYNERQKPILKNIIKSAIGIIDNKIFARKCKIEVKRPIELKEFFNTNNIQGFRNGKLAICLTCDNEVVMSYIFGHPFFGKGKYEWEVIRGATKLNTTIVGGASKLFKYFIKNYDPSNCVYYIDYNYFNGNSLEHIENMEYIKSQVSFKNLFLSNGEVKNRQPGRYKEIKELEKQKLVTRIYNAGTKVYVWNKKYLQIS